MRMFQSSSRIAARIGAGFAVAAAACVLLAAGVATSASLEPLQGCVDLGSLGNTKGLTELSVDPRSMKCPFCAGRRVITADAANAPGSRLMCPACRGEGRLRTNTLKLGNRIFYGPYLNVQILRDDPGVVAFLVRRMNASWSVIAAGSSGQDGVTTYLQRDPRLQRLRTQVGENGLAVAVYYEPTPKKQAKLWPAVLRDSGCRAPHDLE